MKRTTTLSLIAAIAIALAGLVAYAQSDPAGQPPAQGIGAPRHGPPNPGQMIKNLLDKYDVNKDGILDQSEMAALRKDIDDGKIGPPGPGDRGPRGPGAPGGQGFGPPPTAKQLMEKYDADKDGKLDETELSALLKDMHQHRPAPPGGQGAGGPPPDDAPPQ